MLMAELALAGGGFIEAGITVGAANSWNVAGWVILGITATTAIGLSIHAANKSKKHRDLSFS